MQTVMTSVQSKFSSPIPSTDAWEHLLQSTSRNCNFSYQDSCLRTEVFKNTSPASSSSAPSIPFWWHDSFHCKIHEILALLWSKMLSWESTDYCKHFLYLEDNSVRGLIRVQVYSFFKFMFSFLYLRLLSLSTSNFLPPYTVAWTWHGNKNKN